MNAQQTISRHFESYNHNGPEGTQTAAEGFASWVWGCREQALAALGSDLMSLPVDIEYSLHAVAREREQSTYGLPTEDDARQWLTTHRNDLIAAIVESMGS